MNFSEVQCKKKVGKNEILLEFGPFTFLSPTKNMITRLRSKVFSLEKFWF